MYAVPTRAFSTTPRRGAEAMSLQSNFPPTSQAHFPAIPAASLSRRWSMLERPPAGPRFPGGGGGANRGNRARRGRRICPHLRWRERRRSGVTWGVGVQRDSPVAGRRSSSSISRNRSPRSGTARASARICRHGFYGAMGYARKAARRPSLFSGGGTSAERRSRVAAQQRRRTPIMQIIISENFDKFR